MTKSISRRVFARQAGVAGLLALAGSEKISAGFPEGGKTSPFSKKFLEQIPKMQEFAGVPGVAAVMVENNRLSWKADFGVNNAETKQAVTSETVFPAASLSKPVFAYAVLQLRDEGLLDLDRPLTEYFPGEYVPNDPRGKTITAHHALSHSTGLQNWRNQANQQLQLAFAPGERFSYSGEGFFYLQRAVEKITGKGLEQFVRERVFVPFGMKNSSYVWLPQYEKNLTAGHSNRGQITASFSAAQAPKLVELAAKWNKPLETWRNEDFEKALPLIDATMPVLPNFLSMNSAGSLLTTAADYAQFLIRLLSLADGEKFNLKKESFDEMLKPQIKINAALSWGLGIGLETAGTQNYFWHWGDNGNFKTFVIGNRAKRWGMAIFTNGRNGHKIWERIVREATGYDFASFLWI